MKFRWSPSLAMLIACAIVGAARVASAEGNSFTQSPSIAAARTADGVETTGQAAQPAQLPAKTLDVTKGPAAEWIWGRNPAGDDDRFFFRKTFLVPAGAKAARLVASCDNSMVALLNGQRVGSSSEWNEPLRVDVLKHLKTGENELLIDGRNGGGAAGIAAKLMIEAADGTVSYVVSDKSWTAAEENKADAFAAVVTLGKMGVGPWNDVFVGTGGGSSTVRDVFNVLPGFQVELLFTVPKETLGSWVNIATDSKGRLIVSDQGNLGFCRVTPPSIGSSDATKVEHLDIKIDGRQMSGAQGLLWAFDSLYVVCNGGPGSGLYRCKDTDGDDQFDKVELLKSIPGGGEHGPHAVRLSPDGKSLFVCCGNHTRLPFEVKTNAPPQTMGGQRSQQLRATLPEGMTSRLMPNWDEDLLTPRQWDGGGHAVGILAPGGWICKTDPDGKNWEVFTSGYRNQFDFDFNTDGEMFVYDADMEWDFGSPWYRPTRVVHATSGSEFGWRSGTGKWPSYYVDSLPELVNIGPGSPVGVDFGYGAKFPAKYQKALYICDWTFGTMYAIHIEPSGSSYKATKEEFVSRTPLPLTDCTVGNDGALYFTVGGRGAQSELYRVTYVGKESTAAVDPRDTQFAEQRRERHGVEAHHVMPLGAAPANGAIDSLVDQLSSEDRCIRYAARVALERLPVAAWQDKVLTSNETETLINGVVGLARQAEPALLPQIVKAMERIDFTQLPDSRQLDTLRAYQLAFIRLGNPDAATTESLAKKFDDLFPQKSDFVNRELAILMIHFGSPGTVKKLLPTLTRERVASQAEIGELLNRNRGYGGTIAAMLANQPDQQAYHYAFHLRNLKTGWTPAERVTYFDWFNKARGWSGGASYQKFLTNIDNEAFANCTDVERLAVEALGVRKPYVIPALPKPAGPGREYSLADLLSLGETKLKGRNFENGKKTYAAARCVICHRFGGDGGATGPDLTQLAGRFNLKDLSEAIVDPSKVVSDQYKATNVITQDGLSLTGRLVSETADTITLVIDPENATKIKVIKKSDIDTQAPSAVSLMPKDLLKPLSEDEVLDLLAYLLSRGDRNDPMFRP